MEANRQSSGLTTATLGDNAYLSLYYTLGTCLFLGQSALSFRLGDSVFLRGYTGIFHLEVLYGSYVSLASTHYISVDSMCRFA
jgi:hypothetical protein